MNKYLFYIIFIFFNVLSITGWSSSMGKEYVPEKEEGENSVKTESPTTQKVVSQGEEKTENNADSDIDKKQKKEEKDYVNLLLFKVNKGKGYRTQAFENKNNYALLEKRVSYFSFNLGFKSNDIDNWWLDPIAIVDYVYNRNLSTYVSVGHFIGNNIAVGAKFGYSFSDVRLRMSADILDIIISAKTYETNNISRSYTGSFFLKNYIPLDAAQRFFLVSETSLQYSNTNSLSRNLFDEGVKIHKTLREKHSIGVGISPGFMYFMTRGFAFEFAMNPVIAYWERVKTVNNEVEKGSTLNYGLNFKFMPFNIQFGFAYYFGLDYLKNREHVANLKRR